MELQNETRALDRYLSRLDVWAMAAGMQAHIAKPIALEIMMTTLQRVLREHS